MEFEQVCLQIILHSGNGRSLAFEALREQEQGLSTSAKQKIQEAKEELILAGRQHAQLLQQYAKEEALQPTMFVVHAEDHMASSQVVVELVQEMIKLYERMENHT